MQWTFDCVLSALHTTDQVSFGNLTSLTGRTQHIEVLPNIHLKSKVVPDKTRFRGKGIGQRVGQDIGDVADEDRRAFAKSSRLTHPAVCRVALGEVLMR